MIETPSSTPPSLQTNEMVRDYVVGPRLGIGGMAEVYEVRHANTGRRHALKILRPGANEAEAVRHLWLEAQIEAQLEHENIVACTDAGFANDGRPWLVMELMRGPSGRRVIANGPIPIAMALDIGLQLVRALATAHRHGITHGDVKPENFHVVRGHVKLGDFGLAKVRNALFVSAQGWNGTLLYMSPEQSLGGEVDERTDIYSVCLVIKELFLGRLPRVFGSGRSLTEGRAIRALAEPMGSVADRIKGFPNYVANVLERGLARDPGDRWSASELLEALSTIRDRFCAEYPFDAFPTRDGVPVHTPDFTHETPPLDLQGHAAWTEAARLHRSFAGNVPMTGLGASLDEYVLEHSVSRSLWTDAADAAMFARFDELAEKMLADHGFAGNSLDEFIAEERQALRSPSSPTPWEPGNEVNDDEWPDPETVGMPYDQPPSSTERGEATSLTGTVAAPKVDLDATPHCCLAAAGFARAVEAMVGSFRHDTSSTPQDESLAANTRVSCGTGLGAFLAVGSRLDASTRESRPANH